MFVFSAARCELPLIYIIGLLLFSVFLYPVRKQFGHKFTAEGLRTLGVEKMHSGLSNGVNLSRLI